MKFLIQKSICIFAAALSLAGCNQKEAESAKEKAAEAHDDKFVTLSKEQLAHVEIKTQIATLGNLDLTLKAAGRVSENINKTAKVGSTLEGRLTKLNHDINDKVKAGDVLALVETPELIGKPLEIKARIGGVIMERKSTVGELVDKSSTIYTISDPADLWVIAEIKERDLAAVKVGQQTSITVLAYPNATFHGKIVRIGNQVEDASRTLEVRIEIKNEDGRLKPGMFADVEITTTAIENALIIPDSALEADGENQIAFVSLGDGKFEKRIIKLGMEDKGRLQVLDGIKVGEQVVTEGSFVLKSEMLKFELGEE